MSSPAKLPRALDPIYIGSTWVQPLHLFEADKTTPLALDGRTVTIFLNRIGLPEKAVEVVGVENAPGVVVFRDEDTADWPRGVYAVEIRMTDGDDDLALAVSEVTVAKGAARQGDDRVGAARSPTVPGVAVGGAAPIAIALSPTGLKGDSPTDEEIDALVAPRVAAALDEVYAAINGSVVLQPLTLSDSYFALDLAPGAHIADVLSASSSAAATLTLSPTDARLAIAGNAATGWSIVRGLGSVQEGDYISGELVETLRGSPSSPRRSPYGLGAGVPKTLRISATTGSPAGDGSTWETAGDWSCLPAFIAQSNGGEVRLSGTFTVNAAEHELSILAGGYSFRPAVVRGWDQETDLAAEATITGTRQTTSHVFGSDNAVRGWSPFKIYADWITFKDLKTNRHNRIFDLFDDRVGLVWENVSADYYRRFISNISSGSVRQGSLTAFRVSGGEHNYVDDAFIQLASASFGVVEDVALDGHHMRSTTPNPVGLQWNSGGPSVCHDNIVRRCSFSDLLCNTTATGSYWNGDGFVDERGGYNLTYEDCVATGMPDGGFDSKSANSTFLRCASINNKKSFRLWGSGALIDCVSDHPMKRVSPGGNTTIAHIGLPSTTADAVTEYILTNFQARADVGDASPIMSVDTPYEARMTFIGGNVTASGSTGAPAAPLTELNTTSVPPARAPDLTFT